MTVSRYTSIPEMANYLMPSTTRYLDRQKPELQVLTLVGLRDWLMSKQTEISDDPIFLADAVDAFVRGFVRAYGEENSRWPT